MFHAPEISSIILSKKKKKTMKKYSGLLSDAVVIGALRVKFFVVVFFFKATVTLFRPDMHFGVLCKQCRPSLETAKCGA